MENENKSTNEEIAIIGVSGRFPNSTNVSEFWTNLKDGTDCVSKIPGNRWDHSKFCSNAKEDGYDIECKWGGVVDGVDLFDPQFFDMPLALAPLHDPNERLFLETVWNLLESAGYPRKLIDSEYNANVGLFLGLTRQEYHYFASDSFEKAAMSGLSHAAVANRVSHFFNFKGPSVAIDTLCSSSLTAIDRACNSLLNSECQLAVAGGINLSLHPAKYLLLTQGQMLGDDPEQRSFGQGKGYIPAEAIGAVLLKRVSDAKRDGDKIYAVIKSSNAIHGGMTNWLFSPNQTSISNLVNKTLADANVAPESIGYIEASANGSPLADKAEFDALSKSFRLYSEDTAICPIGSVKSNIGHPEAASGICQLIKVVLQLQHKTIVPSIKVDAPNPKLRLAKSPFYLQNQLSQWKVRQTEQGDLPRRALITSIGAGGSNACLVCEEYQSMESYRMPSSEFQTQSVWVFSARSEMALYSIAQNVHDYLIQKQQDLTKSEHLGFLCSLAYTLQTRREEMVLRFAFVAKTMEDVIKSIHQFLQQKTKQNITYLPVGDVRELTKEQRKLLLGQVGRSLAEGYLEAEQYGELAKHWSQGGSVDWVSCYPKKLEVIQDLPNYPFDKSRFWLSGSGNIFSNDFINNKQVAASSSNVDYSYDDISRLVLESITNEIGGAYEGLSLAQSLLELGMNSISGVRLLRQVEIQFHIKISIKEMFLASTTNGLILLVQQKLQHQNSEESIQRKTFAFLPFNPNEKKFPLSEGQKALWLDYTLDPNSEAYLIPIAMKSKNDISDVILKKVVDELVKIYPTLCTYFYEDKTEVFQGISDDIYKGASDLCFVSKVYKIEDKLLESELSQQLFLPMNLTNEPLFKVVHYSNKQSHVLGLTVHHIIADGLSVSYLLSTFVELYQQFSKNEVNVIEPSKYQFNAFVEWEQQYLTSPEAKGDYDYWQQLLKDIKQPVHLTDIFKASSDPQSISNRNLAFTLKKDISARLKQRAISQQLNMSVVFLGLYQILLHKYTDANDIAIGMPVLGRSEESFSHMLGNFANIILVRSQLAAHTGLNESLDALKNQLLESIEHANYPFHCLNNQFKDNNKGALSPYIDVTFAFQNFIDGESITLFQNNEELTLEFIEQVSQSGNVSFGLEVIEVSDEFILKLKFQGNQADVAKVDRFVQSYVYLIEQYLEQEECFIAKLQVLRKHESAALITPRKAYKSNVLLHEKFSQQVEAFGDKHALTHNGNSLTYKMLDKKANQLANYIQKEGVTVNTLVGVGIERSTDLIIAILAILKAGGAYVPLDPRYPNSRLNYIIDDAQLEYLLITTDETDIFSDIQIENIIIINEVNTALEHSVLVPSCRDSQDCNDLAYIIYTSGTTGYPKGVMQTHKNALRLFLSTEEEFAFNSQDVWLLFHSISFDFSVWELWGALLHGGRLVIPSYECTRDPKQVVNLCVNEQVTVLNQTPSSFSSFANQAIAVDAQLPSLRYVIFGGEAIQMNALLSWWTHYGENETTLINMYGITETTVHVTIKKLSRDMGNISVIGSPLMDQSIYLLDQHLNFVPHGAIGEIYVGGAGLAIGYLNQAELTAERFISSPFDVGMRLYKSGDLARQLPNLEFEYIGRSDNQVKIRGFRVELGEVEQQILKHPGVKSSLISVYQKEGMPAQLVAYIMPNNELDEHNLVNSLRQFVGEQLPVHMIPAYFCIVSSWPINENGKIDKARLPTPKITSAGVETVAPTTKNETILVGALQEVLNVEKVGIEDNFYALGGDSLRALSFVASCKSFGLNFSVSEVFKYPTIKSLAYAIETEPAELLELVQVDEFSLISADERKKLMSFELEDAYPLTMLQQGMVLHNLKESAKGLYHDVFSFRIEAGWQEREFFEAMVQLIQRHTSLRSLLWQGGTRPLQLVFREAVPQLTVIDLRGASEIEQSDIVSLWIEEEKHSEFDFTKLLWRIVVHRLSDSEFYYHISFHHAFWDGWSIASLNTELLVTYANHLQNKPLDDEDAPLPYRYFVELEQRAQQSQAHEDYWLNFLNETTSPWWANEPQGKEFSRKLVLKTEQAEAIRALSNEIGVQEKTLFLAMHTTLIWLLTDKENTLTSVVSNGRPEAKGSEKTLGLFLNSLPFKASKFDGSWYDLFVAIEKQLVDSMAYRHYPLADIQMKSTLDFSASLFNYVNFHVYEALPDAINVLDAKQFEKTNFKFAMNCIKDVKNGTYHIALDIDCVAFEDELVDQLPIYIERIIQAMLVDRDAKISRSKLEQSDETPLTENEVDFLANELNQLSCDYPKNVCIHTLFESRATQTPSAIALIFNDETITYGQLNERANQLAHYLLTTQQVQKGAFIGICVERSIEMVIGMIAILKIGSAYVPLDPNYPSERLAFMIEDSNLDLVLSQTKVQGALQALNGTIVLLDGIGNSDDTCSHFCSDHSVADISLYSTASSSDLSYIIYTSGSSGTPKGVLAPHIAVIRLVVNQGFMQLDCDTVMVHCSNIAFDAATLEIWGPLLNGGKCVLYSDQVLTPERLNTLIVKEQVTATFLTSGFFREWVKYADQINLPLQVLTGGEEFDTNGGGYIASHCPNITLIHCYGPTENTTFSTTYTFPKDHDFKVAPIGKRLHSDEAYVLNSEQGLVPFGHVGELYLGGDGLAKGYLNRPELTQKSFINNPFFNDANPPRSKHLYRSGDLVRYLPDGNLEFVGRVDDQVKIRGFRIELGEIESQLVKIPTVDSVLVVTKLVSQMLQLIAYVKPQKDTLLEGDEHNYIEKIKQTLLDQLPEYMVPKFIVLVESWPTNSNGKIDRPMLPDPQKVLSKLTYIAPITAVEITMIKIWSDLLELDANNISADSCFFELGGQSLLALRLNSHIRETFNLELSPKEIFDNTTVQKMASLIERSQVEQYLTDKQNNSVIFDEGTL